MKEKETGLRFAPVVRVSTEKQEKQGESLRTQTAQLEESISTLGGTIPRWYSGQEHSTPAYERKILDQLMEDAKRGRFDAIIVCDTSRWSRDNGRSKQDLAILKQHGIRFFVREREYSLHDPLQFFMLSMGVEVAEYFASEQAYKSLINSIAKAKRGIPVKGRLPYGRLWNKKTLQWEIDPEKQQKILRAIDRYLAGEGMRTIGPSIGLSNTQLHYIFTKSLGTQWATEFTSDKYNIHEKVHYTIPALVDDALIRKIRTRLYENKNIRHGSLKNPYLLARMIFCDDCGTALTGCQYHAPGNLYYRHQTYRGCKKSWSVRADQIEGAVFLDLFQAFGDSLKAAEAVRKATPDPERRQTIEDQHSRCQKDLTKNESQRKNLIDAIADGTIARSTAREKLEELRLTEQALLREKTDLEAELVAIPSKAQVSEKLSLLKRMAKDYFASYKHLDEMSFDDQRALLQHLFAGKTDDGQRPGVYIRREKKTKRIVYTIRGNFDLLMGYIELKTKSGSAA